VVKLLLPATLLTLAGSAKKPGSLQALSIVDLGAGQALHTHGVSQEFHPNTFNDGITLTDIFIKGKTLLETGATVTDDKKTLSDLFVYGE